MKLFTGSGVAIITPFNKNGVNYEVFRQLIEWHIKEKTDAIIVYGTTGESATLSLEEKKEIVKFAVEVAQKRVQIIAGTGSNNTQASIELSQYAESVGADGLLLITPYYNKPTQKGLYAHFKAISDHVNIPIILYNVPSRTSINLLPETVLELSKIKQILAIKEASADISQIAKVIELCPKDFIVYSGNDDQTLPILSLGGKGVISVTANITPRLIHDQVIRYLNGDQGVIESFLKTRELHQMMFIESNPVPVKNALNLMGFNVGSVRLPLVELESENLIKLKDILDKYKLLGDSK
ncbi:4-hydroxy-tetrahydrodipicolinate synthase [Peloplasma aerotolerans]|uniref:4-hydroxy-tetrahydrodipicolinate synthase n=1 Tax=Peloplasma aerotolerans TaxID=3044389 RepID=A0AAW6U8M1_9MOLU|nr:4-hydroxy-tetrahydrodipicolinate synthase [Mariniplasma sp. M4Ah]MDI6452448.1 4-hydroxy-tetrahydrodipicolinate synthase [Mariniplasma sp. M4Ah]